MSQLIHSLLTTEREIESEEGHQAAEFQAHCDTDLNDWKYIMCAHTHHAHHGHQSSISSRTIIAVGMAHSKAKAAETRPSLCQKEITIKVERAGVDP